MHCPWLAGWQITGAKALSSSRVLPPPVVTKKEADQRALTKKASTNKITKKFLKKCRWNAITEMQESNPSKEKMTSEIIRELFCEISATKLL